MQNRNWERARRWTSHLECRLITGGPLRISPPPAPSRVTHRPALPGQGVRKRTAVGEGALVVCEGPRRRAEPRSHQQPVSGPGVREDEAPRGGPRSRHGSALLLLRPLNTDEALRSLRPGARVGRPPRVLLGEGELQPSHPADALPPGCRGGHRLRGGELHRALRAGAAPQKIVYSGLGKREAEIRCAIQCGILMFSVESSREFLTVDKLAGVAVLVNADVDPPTHPHISTGLKKNKFGIAIERAPGGVPAGDEPSECERRWNRLPHRASDHPAPAVRRCPHEAQRPRGNSSP